MNALNRQPQGRTILPLRKAAFAIGVKAYSLAAEVQANAVPHIKIGEEVLFDLDILRRWLEARADAEAKRKLAGSMTDEVRHA